MGDTNLGWIIIVIVVIIIIFLIIWWLFSSNSSNKHLKDKKCRSKNYHSGGTDISSSSSMGQNYTSSNQNGNTSFETGRSFQLDENGQFKVSLPKDTALQDQSYIIRVKLDFSEHKISIQTPDSTPNGRMADGYVAKISHHIFEDSMLFSTKNDPVIQPAEINRTTRSKSTNLSLRKTTENDLLLEFNVSPGVMIVGSITIKIDSLNPSNQSGRNLAIVQG